jgi:hypothetical protein
MVLPGAAEKLGAAHYETLRNPEKVGGVVSVPAGGGVLEGGGDGLVGGGDALGGSVPPPVDEGWALGLMWGVPLTVRLLLHDCGKCRLPTATTSPRILRRGSNFTRNSGGIDEADEAVMRTVS